MNPDLRELSQQLAPTNISPLQRRQAVVQSVQTNSVTIRLGGSTTDVSGVRYLGSYVPAVGSTVWVLQDGPDLLILGSLTPTGVLIPSPYILNFGSGTLRQMINLFAAEYGIGVQNATTYFRTGNSFSWFKQGVHSDTQNDPGAGGVSQMFLDINGELHVTNTSGAAFSFYDRPGGYSQRFAWYALNGSARLWSQAGNKNVVQITNTGDLVATRGVFAGAAALAWDTAGMRVEGATRQKIALHVPGQCAPQLGSDQAQGDKLQCLSSSGTVYIPILASAFTPVSSERFKDDILPLEAITQRTTQIKCIRYHEQPKTYCPRCQGVGLFDGNTCSDCEGAGHQRSVSITRNETREVLGFSAEQLYTVFPEAVVLDGDGLPFAIDLATLVSVAIKTVQEVNAEVEALRTEFEAIKAQMTPHAPTT